MAASADPSDDAGTRGHVAAGRSGHRSVLIGRLLLGYALVSSIVPISPSMPILGLDPSWKVAINRAAAEGMQFGQDIVFTYGPYGAVVTTVYEPGIRPLIFAASLVLAAGYLTATLLVFRRTTGWVHLLAAVAVTSLTSLESQGLDGLLLLYPLLVVGALRELPDRTAARVVALVALLSPLGLLPIVKVSVLPAIVAAVLATGFLLFRRADWPGLAVLAVAPSLNLALWWIAAEQSITGLVDYARGSWYIVAGYSEAMSVPETSRFPAGGVTLIYVLTAGMVLVAGLARRRQIDTLVETGMVAVTLFLAFKAGFVRPDSHMQGGALALLVAGAVVGLHHATPSLRRGVLGVAVGLGASVCYLSGPFSNPVTDLSERTVGLTSDVLRGDVSSAALHRRYDDAMASIRQQAAIPAAQGRSDLYTSSLNLLFAQGAQWDPRPVIQSYSAYTPELAAMNARHLERRGAPRTVFFQVGPIDTRLAALEDGSSWLPLLEHYDVMPESSSYLVLRRRATPRPVAVGGSSHELRARIGERVRIPQDASIWLATFDVRPTLAGKIRTLLWKPPQVSIEVRTADGKTAVRRFVPIMARSQFVLSPYVSDTAGLRSLFPGQPGLDPGRKVTSITLVAHGPAARRFWSGAFSLRLRSLDLTP